MTPEQLGLLVLETYSEGGRLQDALKTHGMSHGAFYRALAKYPSLSQAQFRARAIRADRFADEVVHIPDEILDPQRAKVKIDALKWAAGVYNPGVYSDRLKLDVEGSLDLRAALTARQADRLRLTRDSDETLDAETIESVQPPSLPAPDTQSVVSPFDHSPDGARYQEDPFAD